MTVPRCGRERAVRRRPPRGVLPAASREHATPGRADGLPHPRRAPTPPWHSRGPCSAGAPASPPPWPFEIASTNVVIELGIILGLLIGWQFTLAEFTGGPIMIVLMAVAFRLFVRQRLLLVARHQARQGLAGPLEGHAPMD